MTRLRRSVALGLVVLGALGSLASAQAPRPFLTTVKEIRDGSNWREFRPTKEAIEQPFYDLSYAVNVPFEVRYDGGNVWVVWQATIYWDDPPPEWKTARPPDGLRETYPISAGIYRLDGGSMPEKSVLSDSGGPFKFDPQAPVPTFVTRLSSSIRPGLPPHEPFRSDDRRYAQIRPAKPGWYVLWFGQDGDEDLWPKMQPGRSVISGRYQVDIVVARGERMPSDDVLKYLFERGKRPKDMAEDKLFTASMVQVPFTLRRDGWVFDHLEIQTWDEKFRRKREEFTSSVVREYAGQASASGTDAQLQLRTIESRASDGKFIPLFTQQHDFVLKFPQTMPDYGFAAVELSGGIERTFNRSSPHFTDERSRLAADWDWNATPHHFALTNNAGQALTSLWLHADYVLSPFRDSDASGVPGRRAYFVKDYGEEAAKEWFKPRLSPWPSFGPGKGQPPFSYVLRGRPPKMERFRRLADAGPCPLVVYRLGPWDVLGYYKRLKDVEGRVVLGTPTATEPTIVKETDDFWKWFVKFGFMLGEQLSSALQAQLNATQAGVPLPGLLQTRDRLLLALQEDAIAAMGVQAGTVESRSPLAVAASADATAQQVARIREKVQQVTSEIGNHRKQISQYTDQARAAYDVLLAELDRAYQLYGGPGHPEIVLWRKSYRDQRERVPLEIARSSNDQEFLKMALEESAITGESPDTRVLEAKLQLLTGDAVGAVASLRRALSVEKDHPIARQMLADVECAFLQRAIEKSQGAIADARRHFYGYMMERGFSDRDIQAGATNNLDWLATRIGVYGEEAWAVFTTGVFGSFSSFYGKPAAEADLLATTERQMTTAFIGLHTMRLLRKKGVTFAEMANLPSQQMREKIGSVRSNAEAALLGVAVREAMKLPDVKALMTGDNAALQAGVQQGYWDGKDVSNTWIEWFGDLTSAYNVFTLMLPAAKAGTAGRTSRLMWTGAEAAMMTELQSLSMVKSGTEVVATSLGLTRAINALGATERGKQIAAYLVRLEKYQASLGALDSAVWTAGKISGAMTIGFLTVSATEHLAGEKAAMLVQAAMMFATDTELLVKLLKARNIPPQKIAALIISDYLPSTKVHLKRLAYFEKSAFELEELLARVQAGKKLSAEDFTLLNRYFGSNWRKLTPGAVASENALISLNAAAEGLRNGIDNGALQATKELKPALQAEVKATQQTLQEQQAVADALNSVRTDPNPPTPPVKLPPPPKPEPLPIAKLEVPGEVATPPIVRNPGTPPVGPPPNRPITGQPGQVVPPPQPKIVKSLQAKDYPNTRVLPPEDDAADELGGYLVNPPVAPPSRTADAIQALHNGQYAIAERKFAEIQELIRTKDLTEAAEMTMERLHMYRMAANELRSAKRLFPTGRSPINTPIPATTAEEVLGNRGSWKPRKDSTGKMSHVYDVEGRDDLFIKHVQREFVVEIDGKMEKRTLDVLQDVENNLVHTELARFMGFDVPAMEVRIVYDDSGRVLEAYYLMRKVKGRTLASMTAADVFLYREELARHRALATWLGDFDRKLDNYLITPEGHFVPIDAGMADVTNDRFVAVVNEANTERAKKGLAPLAVRADHPSTVAGNNGRDHWYAKSVAATQGKELLTIKKSLYRKMLLAEESLSFQGAEQVVNDIEKFFGKNATPAQVAEGQRLIEEAYTTMYLQERVRRLAELKGANLADPAIRAALEEEARRSLALKIQEPVEKVVQQLRARAPLIRDAMKGLNERNALPVIETLQKQSGALNIIPFPFEHILQKAA